MIVQKSEKKRKFFDRLFYGLASKIMKNISSSCVKFFFPEGKSVHRSREEEESQGKKKVTTLIN